MILTQWAMGYDEVIMHCKTPDIVLMESKGKKEGPRVQGGRRVK
jgi:hypothetical protein